MKYVCLIYFLLNFCRLCGQVSLPEGVNLSKQQLSAFQEETERKKNQFINCIEKITRNQEVEIRNKNIELGINLFEDTAHIEVSNVRFNSVNKYTVTHYFKNIVGKYYNPNPSSITVIEFWASPVIVNEVVRDKNGNCMALRGHFTFVQKFCKCNERVMQTVEEVPKYQHCYCDRTVKTGLITIKPINAPTGISWTVLLSGIRVDETSEQ